MRDPLVTMIVFGSVSLIFMRLVTNAAARLSLPASARAYVENIVHARRSRDYLRTSVCGRFANPTGICSADRERKL